MKCVYRVLSPDKGAVFLDGKPLKDMNYKTSARSLGVVAQHNYYNFDFSVREVVLMGRSPHQERRWSGISRGLRDCGGSP